MKKFKIPKQVTMTPVFGLLLSLLAMTNCTSTNDRNKQNPSEAGTKITQHEFIQLLNTFSKGWNNNDARMAAECFTEDAIYIEPPDQQLYRGKNELFEFFGGKEGRKSPMNMTWHYVIFDEASQIGTGEYTFAYKGRLTHGIVILQISGARIRRWREYQYRSQMEWKDFIGQSRF